MNLCAIPWAFPDAPTNVAIRKLLEAEGLSYYAWGNDPLDTYSAHTHPFDKVIYVVSGSITFGLPADSRQLTLKPGDRLELPAGISHNAVVGVDGVECFEAHVPG